MSPRRMRYTSPLMAALPYTRDSVRPAAIPLKMEVRAADLRPARTARHERCSSAPCDAAGTRVPKKSLYTRRAQEGVGSEEKMYGVQRYVRAVYRRLICVRRHHDECALHLQRVTASKGRRRTRDVECVSRYHEKRL